MAIDVRTDLWRCRSGSSTWPPRSAPTRGTGCSPVARITHSPRRSPVRARCREGWTHDRHGDQGERGDRRRQAVRGRRGLAALACGENRGRADRCPGLRPPRLRGADRRGPAGVRASATARWTSPRSTRPSSRRRGACSSSATSTARPVACGGWRVHEGPDGPEAELKRMYVAPGGARPRASPGRCWPSWNARPSPPGTRGWCWRPGTRQPEAIALYTSAGYAEVPKFGFYAAEPEAVHLGQGDPRGGRVPIYALGELEPDIHPDAWVHPDATIIGNVTLGGVRVGVAAGRAARRHRRDRDRRADERPGRHDHPLHQRSTRRASARTPWSGTTRTSRARSIGTRCLIASGSVLLNGSVVEDGAVLGAGAVMLVQRAPAGATDGAGRAGAGAGGRRRARGHGVEASWRTTWRGSRNTGRACAGSTDRRARVPRRDRATAARNRRGRLGGGTRARGRPYRRDGGVPARRDRRGPQVPAGRGRTCCGRSSSRSPTCAC